MIVAIAKKENQVSAHFGKSAEYLFVEFDHGRIVSENVIASPPHEPGVMPRFISTHGAQMVVAGGASERAVESLGRMGIRTILGVKGSLDEVKARLLEGTLEAGPSVCHGHGSARQGEGASGQCCHGKGEHHHDEDGNG